MINLVSNMTDKKLLILGAIILACYLFLAFLIWREAGPVTAVVLFCMALLQASHSRRLKLIEAQLNPWEKGKTQPYKDLYKIPAEGPEVETNTKAHKKKENDQ